MTKKKEPRQKTLYVALAVTVLVVIIVVVILAQGNKDYSAFATCLAEKGFVMAGAETCHFCKEQKSNFKGAFEEVIIPAGAYKDCNKELEWCQEKEITGYPTWVLPDDNLIVGVQSLPALARISGCKL